MSEMKRPEQLTLKPCPFCGSNNLAFELDDAQGTKYGGVICADCAAEGPEVRTGYDKSDNAPWHTLAAREWNTRAGEER